MMTASRLMPLCAFALLVAGGCSSGPTSTPARTLAPQSASDRTARAPSASASATSGLPSKLANGWIPEPRIADKVKSTVNSLNQEFPDADLEGEAYRAPDDGNLQRGALFLMVGKKQIDADTALAIFQTEDSKTNPGPYTLCGRSKGRISCVTQTSPTVVGLYLGTSAFSEKSLGKLVATYQADL